MSLIIKINNKIIIIKIIEFIIKSSYQQRNSVNLNYSIKKI